MSEKKDIPYLHTPDDGPRWDWWREDPVELILLVFILVLFFAFPRAGCGVTAVDANQAPPPAATANP